jgi:threonylcarbamoyladenosine tRNA methylthiotransferase MtaB
MTGFHIEHFGCRAARADGEAVGDRLRSAGFSERQPSAADVVVVNTCSVTAEADRAARAFIRRAHRVNPAARIVVTGCLAQRAPEDLAGMDGVAAVVGNSHMALAPEIILGLSDSASDTFPAPVSPALVSVESLLGGGARAPIWADDRFAHSFPDAEQIAPGRRTRPNLKIQEGCGNRCTFCVIPQTRGFSRSLPAAAVLRQVEGFVAAGGKELVLSGINLGRWGRDLSGTAQEWSRIEVSGLPPLRQENETQVLRLPTPATKGSRWGPRFRSAPLRMTGHGAFLEDSAPLTLAGLVRQIFARTALTRLRLSSIEPMDWDAELIGLMAEFGGGRLARHAHLPLQSGSDAVLRRMHRRYRPWHYAEKAAALGRAAGSELTLGADVMVGFPGETDGEFEETLELVRALPFGYLHLFPFSPRPATIGWALHAEHPVPAEAVEERMAALRALASEKSKTHRMRFVDRELEAITLHTPAEMKARARTAALTENFLPAEVKGRLAANRLVRLRVTGLNAEGTLVAEAERPELVQQGVGATSD